MVYGFGLTLHQNVRLGKSALGYSLIFFEGGSASFFTTTDSNESVIFHSAIAESFSLHDDRNFFIFVPPSEWLSHCVNHEVVV